MGELGFSLDNWVGIIGLGWVWVISTLLNWFKWAIGF
jgi:hypothetical protein